MAEYIQTVTVPAGGAAVFALPAGTVRGVYSSAPVAVDWLENSNEGRLFAAVQVWEPMGGFTPRLTSALRFTNSGGAAANITLRLEMC